MATSSSRSRHGGGDASEVPAWLERVGLEPALAKPGTPVTQLSGGQAQRVAVARVLASRRKLLFLDEPSVGLDPHRVRVLARLVREQVRALGVSAIVVTHDVALAAGVADRLFLLSLADRKLEQLFADRWPGALEDPGHAPEERGRWLVELEDALVAHLETHGDRPPPAGTGPGRRVAGSLARLAEPVIAPFRVAAAAAWRAPKQLVAYPRDFAIVARRVVLQTLLRPLVVLRDRLDADRLHRAVRDQQGRRCRRATGRAAAPARRGTRRRARARAVRAAVRRGLGQRHQRVARLDGPHQADARARRARRRSRARTCGRRPGSRSR